MTGTRPDPVLDRVLATVLFTHIVGSTATAVELGDQRWNQLLTMHHEAVRQELERYRRREVDTAGDGITRSSTALHERLYVRWRFTTGSKGPESTSELGSLPGRSSWSRTMSAGSPSTLAHVALRWLGKVRSWPRATVVDPVAGSGLRFRDGVTTSSRVSRGCGRCSPSTLDRPRRAPVPREHPLWACLGSSPGREVDDRVGFGGA